MRQVKIDVLFDRRKLYEKKGFGYLEVRVYFARRDVRYVTVCTSTPDKWEIDAKSNETLAAIKQCEKIISAMEVLGEELTKDNFNKHFLDNGEDSVQGLEECEDSTKDFIAYCEQALSEETLRDGTRRHKRVVLDAVIKYGKLKTYADLVPAKIVAFDKWLHNGERSDVTIMGYHKKVHKWIRQLHEVGEIENDPYKSVKLSRGKSKEREPLIEDELKILRDASLRNEKLERVRDLFIFSAYTGLSYSDTQCFDFETMVVKQDDMYYIDGSRVKTGTKFFTPILTPALQVLEKYNYKLPHITNQKANDYLHVIEAQLGFTKSLTFHVARHSFATLALAHDIPIENVARMLGHENIKTTQIYAKILHSTIERHAIALQASII